MILCFSWLWLSAATATTAGLTLAAQEQRPSIDLSGEWEFKLDPFDVGRAQKWFEPGVVYERKIRVPGAWNAQGAAFESPDQLRAYEEKVLEEQKALNRLGILGVQRESDRLLHVFPGPAWYRKTVTIPAEWQGKAPWLIFSGVHRAVEVWINGQSVGAHHSYLTPLRLDLARHAKAGDTVTVVARVDARRHRDIDPLMGCLDTLDFLYVTWGGIHQPVKLEAGSAARIEEVFVAPRLADETAVIQLTFAGEKLDDLTATVEIVDADGALAASQTQSVAQVANETTLTAHLAKPRLWSPGSPHLYTAKVRLLSGAAVLDARSVRFGMREFSVADGGFQLNGRPIFLRGYGDDCIFPNTICPPSDKEELRARLTRAREYGFNYVRHHSWTPPEAYLEVADELGMMLQPEFPFAYRSDLPTTPEAKRAALAQWEAVIRLNRNHPSIVTWCMGNELYDSFDLAPEMYRTANRLDPTRPVIDSDGCSFKHQDRETLDFLVVQFGEGDSIGHQDAKYRFPSEVKKPVIAHEMGYFVTLPDLEELGRFKNGVRPYWLYETRELASRNGVLGDYAGWRDASYRLQAVCLKSNLEAARRSRLSGTSVWLFQDYPNCAEGVVTMFGQPKGLSAEAFRRFNAPTVLLLDAPRRNWWSGETATLKLLVSRFEDAPTDNATLRWELRSDQETLLTGKAERLRVGAEGLQELVPLALKLPPLVRGTRLTLETELVDANGTVRNAWGLWVFPPRTPISATSKVRFAGTHQLRQHYGEARADIPRPRPEDTDLLVTQRLGEETLGYLRDGGRVILLEPEPTFAVEKTNFRLSSWDGGGPSGTVLDPRHPALTEMPSDGWCDLQFYDLIQGSKTVLLSSLPVKAPPLVRCIDRPTRLSDRAYLFEASVGRGRLLVSGFNFDRALNLKDPAALHLLDSLIRYATGPEFAPRVALPEATLKGAVAK